VVLFTFDTTRADFLGCYGKTDARTPHLDRMAAEGYLFERAYTSNPVTQAAHSTILTGVYPMVHGVRDNTFFHLPDSQQTLAEILREEGYATAAAIGGFPLTREFGTAQGFDFYDDDLTADRRDMRGRPTQRSRATWYDERPAAEVNDAVLPWLRQLRKERDSPFFLWLHYWDPHEPHIPPPPYDQLFVHEPYSGEISYADENLGRLLRELESMGELERTLIVMTADHGEGRLEHNEMTHAFLAYDTTIRVPLILRVPGRDGGRRIEERVGTVDIVPTVLDMVGIDLPGHLQGRSLEPVMQREASQQPVSNRRPYYAESLSPRLSHGIGELRVLFQGPYKYIHGPRSELFDMTSDARELDDLVDRAPEQATILERSLQSFLAEHASAEGVDATYEATEATRRQLEALGYLTSAGGQPDAVVEELRSDGEPPQDQVENVNLMIRLRNLLGGGQFLMARDVAKRLLEGAPDHAFFRGNLAAAELGLGEVEAAVQVVENSTTISSANLADFLRVAQALFEGGEQERGLELAHRLLAQEETSAGRLTLARLYREAGRDAECEENLERALELEPESLQARIEKVSFLIDNQRLEEAEAANREILAAYPVLSVAHSAAGKILAARGEADEALGRFNRAILLAPGRCDAHQEKIQLLSELERASAAEEALESMRAECRDVEAVRRAEQILQEGTRQ
jgi:arylsulfatase A-like enzyme/Tfp pilus assembly protein PilF